MKKAIATYSLVAAAMLAGPTLVRSEIAPPHYTYSNKLPTQQFHGRITAVNPAAHTITLGNRVIRVSTSTRMDDKGTTIGLGDLSPGEFINLAYKADTSGRLHALVVHVHSTPKHFRSVSR